MQHLVSYVMAAYNHERYIARMIDSILNQTYKNIELIIVDDGSSDVTPDVAEQYAQTDSRVTVIRQVNHGIVAARNTGLKKANGEFVTIVDSDDELANDHAARLYGVLQQSSDVVMVYGDSQVIDQDGNLGALFSKLHPVVSGEFSVELWSNYCFVSAPTVMFRHSAMKQTGYLWGAGGTTDYIKWIEIGTCGKVVRIDGEPVAWWRHHGENFSQMHGVMRAKQYLDLIDDLKEVLRKHSHLDHKISATTRKKRYAHCKLRAGFHLLLARNWKAARSLFMEVVREDLSWRAVVGILLTVPVVRKVGVMVLPRVIG